MERGQIWTVLMALVLLAAVATEADDLFGQATYEENRHEGSALVGGHGENEGEDSHGDGEGGHHGVRLASWRWGGYGSILMVLVMIILAGVLKILFHHWHFLSENFPESCILIIIGIAIGATIYELFEAGNVQLEHKFPEFTSGLFFNVLLPPIILDAAYAL